MKYTFLIIASQFSALIAFRVPCSPQSTAPHGGRVGQPCEAQTEGEGPTLATCLEVPSTPGAAPQAGMWTSGSQGSVRLGMGYRPVSGQLSRGGLWACQVEVGPGTTTQAYCHFTNASCIPTVALGWGRSPALKETPWPLAPGTRAQWEKPRPETQGLHSL